MSIVNIYSSAVITCVGLSSLETASSVRAGLTGFGSEDGDWLDSNEHPVTIGCIPEDALYGLTDKLIEQRQITNHAKRLIQLAGTALCNDFRHLPPLVPLYLALPEPSGVSPIAPNNFLVLLSQQTDGLYFDSSISRADFSGRSAGLSAMAQAFLYIQENPGKLVIVGGVDSYDDPVVLQRLDCGKRLKTDRNLDGFIPGEGAGFVLLGDVAAGQRHNLPPLAQISMPAFGNEEGHRYSDKPYRGAGLATTFSNLFSANPLSTPIQDIYSTMNGESYWTKEWGVACNRNTAAFAPNCRMHHPAENFGDIGAAFGPVLSALAAIGINKGYRQSPVLVYTSSDYGDRAATLVSRVT